MIKYHFCFLQTLSLFSSENKKVTEITRYELGNCNCSDAIGLIENNFFYDFCKWDSDKYTFIEHTEITEFVLAINRQMMDKQSKVRPQKGKCKITKYADKIKCGGNEYVIDEVLCKGDPNCFLVNQLYDIFKI